MRHLVLSVPASSDRMVEKGRGLDVDEVLLDLEDAVRPEDKDAARARVVAALAERWKPTVTVRVNAPGTPWCHRDLLALAAAPPAAVIVPKVESTGDLAFVERLLEGAGAPSSLRTQALIESAPGLARVDEIAASGGRLEGLVLGYADLGAALGRSTAAARDLLAWGPAQHAVLLAARAHGLAAIDGPWLGTADDDASAAAARTAAGLGFDGKWVIHPRQLATLRAAFAPTDEQADWARRVLAALEEAPGGAVELDGEMLDEAVAVAARRLLARVPA